MRPARPLPIPIAALLSGMAFLVAPGAASAQSPSPRACDAARRQGITLPNCPQPRPLWPAVREQASPPSQPRPARRVESEGQRKSTQPDTARTNLAYCRNENVQVTWDVMRRACTALIESGRQRGADLAESFVNRGNSYLSWPGDAARAIADYDQAIRLDPQNANAYAGRGTGYFRQRDYARAIAEYDQAIRLNPREGYYRSRAAIYYQLGDRTRWWADLTAAARLHGR